MPGLFWTLHPIHEDFLHEKENRGSILKGLYNISYMIILINNPDLKKTFFYWFRKKLTITVFIIERSASERFRKYILYEIHCNIVSETYIGIYSFLETFLREFNFEVMRLILISCTIWFLSTALKLNWAYDMRIFSIAYLHIVVA